jgi:hypothetical protein
MFPEPALPAFEVENNVQRYAEANLELNIVPFWYRRPDTAGRRLGGHRPVGPEHHPCSRFASGSVPVMARTRRRGQTRSRALTTTWRWWRSSRSRATALTPYGVKQRIERIRFLPAVTDGPNSHIAGGPNDHPAVRWRLAALRPHPQRQAQVRSPGSRRRTAAEGPGAAERPGPQPRDFEATLATTERSHANLD